MQPLSHRTHTHHTSHIRIPNSALCVSCVLPHRISSRLTLAPLFRPCPSTRPVRQAGLDPIASTVIEDLMRSLHTKGTKKKGGISSYVVVTHQVRPPIRAEHSESGDQRGGARAERSGVERRSLWASASPDLCVPASLPHAPIPGC